MRTYKVYYRYNGRTDNAWVFADDELSAQAEVLRRNPKVSIIQACLMAKAEPKEDLIDVTHIANIIEVDFINRRRKSA